MEKKIISVSYADYKSYLDKIEDRRHYVKTLPNSFDEVNKTVDIEINPIYFKKISLKYADYKRNWKVDCFKIQNSYDEDTKTIEVWINIKDYIYYALDFSDLYFDRKELEKTGQNHLIELIKAYNISNDYIYRNILAYDFVVNKGYYLNLSSFKLFYWDRNRIISREQINNLKSIYKLFS